MKINPDLLKTVLYDNPSGTVLSTNGTITLNDDISNYKYIEIIGDLYNQTSTIARVKGTSITLSLISSTWADTLYVRFAHINISAKTLKATTVKLCWSYSTATGSRDGEVTIYSVIGYK